MSSLQVILDKLKNSSALSISQSTELTKAKILELRKLLPNTAEDKIILLSTLLETVNITILTREELERLSTLNLETLNYLGTHDSNHYFKQFRLKEKPAFDTGRNIIGLPYSISEIKNTFPKTAIANKNNSIETIIRNLYL